MADDAVPLASMPDWLAGQGYQVQPPPSPDWDSLKRALLPSFMQEPSNAERQAARAAQNRQLAETGYAPFLPWEHGGNPLTNTVELGAMLPLGGAGILKGITVPAAKAAPQILERLLAENNWGKLGSEGNYFARGGSTYDFTTPSGQQVQSYINGRTHPEDLNEVGFLVNGRYGRRSGGDPRADFMDILRGVRDHVTAYIEQNLQNPNFNGVTFAPHGGTKSMMEAKNAIYGKFAKAIADKYGLHYSPQDVSSATTTKTRHNLTVPERSNYAPDALPLSTLPSQQ